MRIIFVGAASAAIFALVSSVPDAAHALSPANDEIALDLGAGATIVAGRVRAGSFAQGSPTNDEQREPDEAPPRNVRIAHDFYVARTPVTRGAFAVFAATSAYRTEAEKGTSGGQGWNGHELTQAKAYTWRNPGFAQGDDHPVVLVTYADAEAFAAWASQRTGLTVRLPTEAEYELATRAGTTTRFYSGDTKADALAIGWFKSNAENATHPVATKQANALGLFDLSGNVYEWCRDVYAPYAPGDVVDPLATTPAPGEPVRRVLRGGSWLRDPKRGRSAARYRSTPGTRSAEIGFRVVVEVPTATIAPTAPSSAVPLKSTTTGSSRSSSDGLPVGLFVGVGAGLAVVGAGLVALLSRRGRSGSPPAPGRGGPYRGMSSGGPRVVAPAGVDVTFAADGFWVRAPHGAFGPTLAYSAIVNGQRTEGVVAVTHGPQGTFVYTGHAPTEVRIELGGFAEASSPSPSPQEIGQQAGLLSNQRRRDDDDDDDSGSSSSGSSFIGFPSAY